MERLLEILNTSKEINGYKVVTIKKHQYQLFFVQDKVETNRVVDSTIYKVFVYVDVESKRGMGSFTYAPYDDDKEAHKKLDEAIFNAKLALNPYYDLPSPSQEKPIELKSNLSEREFSDIAYDIARAIFKADMSEKCYSSATEIFLTKTETRVINSLGLDVNETKYEGEIELIPTYETNEKEVEVYHLIQFLEFDSDKITNEVNEVLNLVKARHNAIELPKGLNIPVIIDGGEVGQFFEYFLEDTAYQVKYTKNNLYELNQDIQKNGNGSKLNLTLSPYAKGVYSSSAIDLDGIVLKDTQIINNGIISSRHGSNQYGQYLKEEPTGVLPVLVVSGGQTPIEEMKTKPYLRCVRFSALQIDRISGYYGGEVRLGFYFDGEKEIPVTGFTISCNLHDVVGDVVYSKELDTYENYFGPKYLYIPKMSIN